MHGTQAGITTGAQTYLGQSHKCCRWLAGKDSTLSNFILQILLFDFLNPLLKYSWIFIQREVWDSPGLGWLRRPGWDLLLFFFNHSLITRHLRVKSVFRSAIISSVWTLCQTQGFPDGTSGKDTACQCRRHKRCRFNSGVRNIPWGRKWQPTAVLLPGKSHGQRSLVVYSA